MVSILENVDRDILEERVVPEKEKVLTSKRYMTTAAGTVLREIRVSFCDYGGERLSDSEQTVICCEDQRKLCNSHAIRYLGRYYCPDCLQHVLPLDRLQFKIIHGLINELSLDDIRELARSKKDEFHSALSDLVVDGYLEKKGISLFSYYEVLDRGILAWRTYLQAFNEADVAQFMQEVDEHLKEVKANDISSDFGKGR